jgi:hypothetical protein
VEARLARSDGFDDLDEGLDLDVDAGLLAHLADGGLFKALAPLEAPARHHPAPVLRRLAALDEQDVARVVEDHGAHADEGPGLHGCGAGLRPRERAAAA